MATGISNQRRKDMLAWLAGQSPTAPAAFQVAVWTADCGDDGQSSTEVAPTGYARGSIAVNTGWTTPAGASGSPVTMSNASGTPIALGTWSTGPTTVSHIALFTSLSTAANFIARFAISGTSSVTAGSTVSIAQNALVLSLTFT